MRTEHPAYIIDSNADFKTGLCTFLPWKKFRMIPEILESDGLNVIAETSYRQGLTLCEDVMIKEHPLLYRPLRERSPSHKLLLLTKEKNLESLEIAFSLKADALMVKPLPIERLEEAISELSPEPEPDTVGRDYGRQETADSPKTELERVIFEYSVTGTLNHPRLRNILARLGFAVGPIICALYKLPVQEQCRSLHTDIKDAVERVLNVSLADDFICICIETGYHEITVLIQSLNSSTVETAGSRLTETFSILKKNLGIDTAASLSDPCRSTAELARGIDECRNRIEGLFWGGYNRLYASAERSRALKPDIFSPHIADTLITAVNGGKTEAIRQILNDVKGKVSDQVAPEHVKMQFAAMLVEILHSYYDKCDRETMLSRDYFDTISAFCGEHTFSGMLERLVNHATEISQDIFTKRHDTQSSAIASAMAFIKNSYNEQISLETMAERVHMSQSYFSRTFKKISGENFNEFLVSQRLDAAKRLLIETNYKTYEIAEKVGIFDGNYFSRLFKQKFHMTPSQYKDKSSEAHI